MPQHPETTKDLLIAARAKIAKPARWTKKSFARTQYQDSIDSNDPDAVCWCSVGALKACAGKRQDLVLGATYAIRAFVLKKSFSMFGRQFDGILDFNDDPETTHKDVMRLFDAAIKQQD